MGGLPRRVCPSSPTSASTIQRTSLSRIEGFAGPHRRDHAPPMGCGTTWTRRTLSHGQAIDRARYFRPPQNLSHNVPHSASRVNHCSGTITPRTGVRSVCMVITNPRPRSRPPVRAPHPRDSRCRHLPSKINALIRERPRLSSRQCRLSR